MQQNPYKGNPERPWIRIRMIAPDQNECELELVADTGNPFSIIVSPDLMRDYQHRASPQVDTNFGILTGGLLRIDHISLAGIRRRISGQPVFVPFQHAQGDASRADASGREL